jgi:hypothetical protein
MKSGKEYVNMKNMTPKKPVWNIRNNSPRCGRVSLRAAAADPAEKSSSSRRPGVERS